MGGERLTTQAVACIDESVRSVVHVGIVNLGGVTDHHELRAFRHARDDGFSFERRELLGLIQHEEAIREVRADQEAILSHTRSRRLMAKSSLEKSNPFPFDTPRFMKPPEHIKHETPVSPVKSLFLERIGSEPEAIGYAPGRIEVIGNHTDYNGGEVLGAAVDMGIHVAVGMRSDGLCHFVSAGFEGSVDVPLDAIVPQEGAGKWVNYSLGVARILRDEGFPVNAGFNLADTSTLPSGAGMSSSAAIELATACALSGLFGFELDRAKLAKLGRRAENEFVGMPCGILDQGVSAFGATDHLVHIDCFTEEFRQVPMPAGCQFWIFNSNKKHSLVESQYADRHRECSEAFEILKPASPGSACLAHIDPSVVRSQRDKLGEVCYRRALHVTEENRRVQQAIEALAAGDLSALGKLLTASHESSRTLFENSVPELDFLVEQAISQPGVFGARLTGGGFGGAVMALTDERFAQEDGPQIVEKNFAEKFQVTPTIFHCRAGAGATTV